MPEVLMPEQEIEEKTYEKEKVGKDASDELENIRLGQDFSTGEIRKFQSKLLCTINGEKDGLDREAVQKTLEVLRFGDATVKSFDVEVQSVADIFSDLIHGPNSYRMTNSSNIHFLIEFYNEYVRLSSKT